MPGVLVTMGVTVMVVDVIAVMIVRVRLKSPRPVLVHEKARGRDAGPQHPFRADVVARHGQTAESFLEALERQTGIDQGAKHHVAGDSRETVEIEYA